MEEQKKNSKWLHRKLENKIEEMKGYQIRKKEYKLVEQKRCLLIRFKFRNIIDDLFRHSTYKTFDKVSNHILISKLLKC